MTYAPDGDPIEAMPRAAMTIIRYSRVRYRFRSYHSSPAKSVSSELTPFKAFRPTIQVSFSFVSYTRISDSSVVRSAPGSRRANDGKMNRRSGQNPFTAEYPISRAQGQNPGMADRFCGTISCWISKLLLKQVFSGIKYSFPCGLRVNLPQFSL